MKYIYEFKKNQLSEIDISHEQLYEDRLEGNISERNFNLICEHI